jgi:hypothetical protein
MRSMAQPGYVCATAMRDRDPPIRDFFQKAKVIGPKA